MNDYESTARYYDLFRRPSTLELDFYRRFVKPRSRVLDMGCGTGDLTLSLARSTRRCHFDCVDLSQAMLEVFAEKIEKKRGLYTYADAIHLHRADMTSFEAVDTYDFIFFASQSIQCTARSEVAVTLARAAAWLKPRAYMVVTFFNAEEAEREGYRESIQGFRTNEDGVYIATDGDYSFDDELFRYTLTVAHYDARRRLVSRERDSFAIAKLGYGDIQRLHDGADLELSAMYSSFDRESCSADSRDFIAVYRKSG